MQNLGIMSTEMEPFLRIGQLAEATGVDATVLRTWEARYGVPVPERTEGGQRRYPQREVERMRAMRSMVDSGYRASEAARMVTATLPREGGAPQAPNLDRARDDLTSRLVAGDMGAIAVLDRLVAALPVEDVIEDVVVPIMREVGDRWADGRITVAEEHAATWLVSSWVGSQVRSMPPPLHKGLIVTAAPQGERHELGLELLGLLLRRQGIAVLHLGSDLPPDDLAAMAKVKGATCICLSASTREANRGLLATIEAIAALKPPIPVGVGGAMAAISPLPLPAFALPHDMRAAAQRLLSLTVS